MTSLLFALQLANSSKVSEQVFFQLVQSFAVVLFECNEHEDYLPATCLMHLALNTYHEGCRSHNNNNTLIEGG